MLRDLSVRDSLTGLYNRRYMEESFDREIERACRSDRPLAVVMIDVDCFKAINDTYGHVMGDSILVFVAEFFLKSIRGSDIACRYGGDEFMLILPECSYQEAAERAESMRAPISAAEVELLGQKGITFTLSFGIASLPKTV
jgi:diguanylate cyclase (GGDEF)-like protein